MLHCVGVDWFVFGFVWILSVLGVGWCVLAFVGWTWVGFECIGLG